MATILVAAACGASGTPAETGQAQPDQTTQSGQAAQIQAGQKGFGTEEFGLSYAELAQRAEDVEQQIGNCMAESGFEYVPVDFDTVRQAMTSDKSAPGMSHGEFVAQYGYGISTQPDKPIVSLSAGTDNQRILDDLPETDQVAYRRELYGGNSDATFAFALELEDFSRIGGCTRSAVEAYFSPEEMLASYYNPVDAAIDADPRMQEALGRYGECMARASYEYRHPDQVEDGLWELYDAILGDKEPSELTESERAELSDLQQFELTLAPIATDCERSIFDPTADTVERELHGSNSG